MAGSFSLDLSKFVEKSKLNAVKVVQKVCFDMFSRIVQRTPVDTGRLRAGWQVGINSIPAGAPAPTGKRVMASSIASKGSISLSDPSSQVAGVSAMKLEDTVYLVNNVEYAAYLEYGTGPGGYSRQAPQGMVRITITEFQDFVAKAIASMG